MTLNLHSKFCDKWKNVAKKGFLVYLRRKFWSRFIVKSLKILKKHNVILAQLYNTNQ